MKVGSIGYSCASGLGHLNKWLFEHGVVDSVFVVEHPQYASNPSWFPGAPSTPLRGMNLSKIMEWSKSFDVILCYETPFAWALASWWRSEAKIKTAIMPMHEWYPQDRLQVLTDGGMKGAFDLYLCPSALDLDVFKAAGCNTAQVTVPVDPSTWRQRRMVRRFLHNAGHVGHREHKGTRQLLEAMCYVTKPIDLTVRGQGIELERMIQEFTGMRGAWGSSFAQIGSVATDAPGSPGRITYEIEDRPYGDLFPLEFDAYVAPEKLNGLSLPLQEARAAGMLVITTDRYPTNTWLPNKVEVPSEVVIDPDDGPLEGDVLNALIPVERYQKARVCTNCVEIDEAIVDPKAIAATLDAWHGADVGDYSVSGFKWAIENSWKVWAPRYRKLLEDLL